MSIARNELHAMFPERNDWDVVSVVREMLSREQEYRCNIERDIAVTLFDQGLNFDVIYPLIDKEIAELGLEPMSFKPVLRREDYE